MNRRFLFSLLLFPFLSFGQWDPVGDNTSTGNLIIGYTTANSYSKLVLRGPNSPHGIDSKRDIIFDFAAAGDAHIRAYRGTSWDTYLQFMTSAHSNTGGIPATRMHISENGNVGIGTTTPNEKLEVYGAIRIKPMEPIYFLAGSHDPNYLIQSGEWNDGMKYKHWTSHQFFTTGQEKIRISKPGNLLIGKTSQTNTTYKLDVAGKVRANEIVVNTTGADYVFEEDYQLKTLSEVEVFICEHGHLPDIPSAKEMQTNGMAVGELYTKFWRRLRS